MATFNLNIIAASGASLDAGEEDSTTFTITDPSAVPLNVDDQPDTIFNGDSGSGNEVGVDSTQVLTGTSDQVYLERIYEISNSDGTWEVASVETGGTLLGWAVVSGPSPIPTGVFTIVSDTNVVGLGGPSFDSLVVPCLVRGALIETCRGQIAVEDLEVGDLVITRDHGPQPIRWVGSRTVAGIGKQAPICIAEGAMGNTRDLLVSPNHRMVLEGRQMEVLFGTSETLIAASLLVNDTNIRPAPKAAVEYFHVLFDQHEVIFAEGIPTESFHPGQGGVDALSAATRDEILQLFPQLEGDLAAYGPSARQVLTAAEYAAV